MIYYGTYRTPDKQDAKDFEMQFRISLADRAVLVSNDGMRILQCIQDGWFEIRFKTNDPVALGEAENFVEGWAAHRRVYNES